MENNGFSRLYISDNRIAPPNFLPGIVKPYKRTARSLETKDVINLKGKSLYFIS